MDFGCSSVGFGSEYSVTGVGFDFEDSLAGIGFDSEKSGAGAGTDSDRSTAGFGSDLEGPGHDPGLGVLLRDPERTGCRSLEGIHPSPCIPA